MNIFEELANLLIEKKYTISAGESCTGGMFISNIISVPNTSNIVGASFITYSNEAKVNILDVKNETIEKFGVVSENVAIEMAKGACKKAGTNIGVGITGFAGPAWNENDDSVGTVCFGFCIDKKTVSATKHYGDLGRNVIRELATVYCAETILRFIKK